MILAYRLALSLEKTVGTILETLDKALDYAKPAYAEGTGAVTTIDLSRLEFGKSKALGFQAMLENRRSWSNRATFYFMPTTTKSSIQLR